MQYAFNITGIGAEVTQGRVTKDFIQEIYSKLIDEETVDEIIESLKLINLEKTKNMKYQ